MSTVSLSLHTSAFELKGSLLPLMVLYLLENDIEKIAEQLAQKIQQAPNFFQNAPVVIDLQALNLEQTPIDLMALAQLLRQHQLMPVGIRGGNATHNERALNLSLGIFSETKEGKRDKSSKSLQETESPLPPPSKLITQPIRSGQQVVCLHGDLIVLAAVSPGAEILAHRHIHVYGALRGRALAGVNGDTQARIFCQTLDAELVSIAGQYQINEELPNQLRGKPAQIYLENDKLKIESLYSSTR